MEANQSNVHPMDDRELSPVERHLLEQKGYSEAEIDAIERSIIDGFVNGTRSYLHEERSSTEPQPVGPRTTWRSELTMEGAAQHQPFFNAFFDTEDALPGLEETWKATGVRGVIKRHRDFFVSVEDTFYTFRDWKQVQLAFFEAELTPLPSRAEIESACGRAGLGLPSVSFDGIVFFDLEFVGASDESKARRAREHAQAREEVLRYLVGKRIERWEE